MSIKKDGHTAAETFRLMDDQGACIAFVQTRPVESGRAEVIQKKRMWESAGITGLRIIECDGLGRVIKKHGVE